MEWNRRLLYLCAVMTAFLSLWGASAEAGAGGYDYSHRKSVGKVTVRPGATVRARLVRNHFTFGASINRWSFDTLQKDVAGVTQDYGDAFVNYFDVATPENEMKWTSVQGDSVKRPPDWTDADFLMDFCLRNNIAVRAHNLFWVEKRDWIPKWTWTLGPAEFRAAMSERISDAMTRFKGKVVQWDIINEIIHGYAGQTPAVTMFDTMSGDPNVFAWILDEARKIDGATPFVLNDYNLIPSNQSPQYIAKCKPLMGRFDVIGDEGHYGNYVFNRANIDSKAKALSDGLGGKKIWCTEVDWQFDVSLSPSKMEEIMRTCFANRNIEGLILWTWVKRRMWLPMTSVLADSLLVETPTGKRYREVRAEWKTDTTGKADAQGVFTFTGYQGRYQIVSDGDTQCVYLYPRDSTVVLSDRQACRCPPAAVLRGEIVRQPADIHGITFRGKTLTCGGNALKGRNLSLAVYSLDGRRIREIPFTMTDAVFAFPELPRGCAVFRLRGAGRTLWTGIAANTR
jgi:GH35 family endo-1,4-beta-xylanase